MSEALDKAKQIIRTWPLPDDAEQQLEALEQQIDPGEEQAFALVWETYIPLAGPQDIPEPE